VRTPAFLLFAAFLVATSGAPSALAAEASGDAVPFGGLKYVDCVTSPDLDSVNHVRLSKDGEFLYCCAWRVGRVSVYRRDAETGLLSLVQVLASENDDRTGVTSLEISPDGTLAVANGFMRRSVVLLRRNPESGELARLHTVISGENGAQAFVQPIDVCIGPEGRFIYVPDDSYEDPAQGQTGAVHVLAIRNDALEFVETNLGREACFNGIRGMCFHPEGKWGYAFSSRADAVAVVKPDPETGTLEVAQVLRDGQDGVSAIDGVMNGVCSLDGKYLYVASGRFDGDSAVSAYAINGDGTLSLLKEVADGTGGLANFQGGNDLAISPDGWNVYCGATRSGTVGCFSVNPDTGAHECIQVVAESTPRGPVQGAAGVDVSPDGRFVYVAAEFRQSVSIFERQVE
jgi:6-phosphogluconolactonase (cycloisomerase 2 family)